MFSHVTVGANDYHEMAAFYDAVLAPLGLARFWADEDWGAAGWRIGEGGPAFYIGRPFNRLEATSGNGAMCAFQAPDHAAVQAAHAAALAFGGSCEGEPGLRPQYGPAYYGAYFRDPEGNKIHVVRRG